MAEVMKFTDFKEEGSEAACKAAGQFLQIKTNTIDLKYENKKEIIMILNSPFKTNKHSDPSSSCTYMAQ